MSGDNSIPHALQALRAMLDRHVMALDQYTRGLETIGDTINDLYGSSGRASGLPMTVQLQICAALKDAADIAIYNGSQALFELKHGEEQKP